MRLRAAEKGIRWTWAETKQRVEGPSSLGTRAFAWPFGVRFCSDDYLMKLDQAKEKTVCDSYHLSYGDDVIEKESGKKKGSSKRRKRRRNSNNNFKGGGPGGEMEFRRRLLNGRTCNCILKSYISCCITMDTDYKLPLKVGQDAEAKSFLTGYRGAWFRCKIMDIGWRKGQLSHALDFFDFPDEKTTWTKLYQKPPNERANSRADRANSREKKMELMVRPSFPPVYRESQIHDVSAVSEVVVIVANVWKVGDLVDWWTDGCHWTARITHLLGNDKVKVELPKPPFGEGKSYEAFCKDLRPSLDWSPEQGWTVPTSTDNGTCCCARLIQRVNQDKSREDGCATGEAPSSQSIAPISSRSSACSLPVPDTSEHPPEQETTEQPSCGEIDEEGQNPHTNTELGLGGSSMGKANGTCSVSSSSDKGASVVVARTTGRKDRYGYGESPKKMRISGNDCLNSMCSDTIESAILDLEELANRIKWLKGVLQLGFPLSNAMRPPWKFLENRAFFTQR
ncbi:hypothetical protein NE237_014785 [Protea cynaroides]|uniref:Agenet domain-containing protein n=1 Tax=Protea cynaroides TaxID=273540 RepID=A0A9Q0QQL4_9MAGN|nr:hypothetical protein NE237_014785 [Protea cynaroides]